MGCAVSMTGCCALSSSHASPEDGDVALHSSRTTLAQSTVVAYLEAALGNVSTRKSSSSALLVDSMHQHQTQNELSCTPDDDEEERLASNDAGDCRNDVAVAVGVDDDDVTLPTRDASIHGAACGARLLAAYVTLNGYHITDDERIREGAQMVANLSHMASGVVTFGDGATYYVDDSYSGAFRAGETRDALLALAKKADSNASILWASNALRTVASNPLNAPTYTNIAVRDVLVALGGKCRDAHSALAVCRCFATICGISDEAQQMCCVPSVMRTWLLLAPLCNDIAEAARWWLLLGVALLRSRKYDTTADGTSCAAQTAHLPPHLTSMELSEVRDDIVRVMPLASSSPLCALAALDLLCVLMDASEEFLHLCTLDDVRYGMMRIARQSLRKFVYHQATPCSNDQQVEDQRTSDDDYSVGEADGEVDDSIYCDDAVKVKLVLRLATWIRLLTRWLVGESLLVHHETAELFDLLAKATVDVALQNAADSQSTCLIIQGVCESVVAFTRQDGTLERFCALSSGTDSSSVPRTSQLHRRSRQSLMHQSHVFREMLTSLLHLAPHASTAAAAMALCCAINNLARSRHVIRLLFDDIISGDEQSSSVQAPPARRQRLRQTSRVSSDLSLLLVRSLIVLSQHCTNAEAAQWWCAAMVTLTAMPKAKRKLGAHIDVLRRVVCGSAFPRHVAQSAAACAWYGYALTSLAMNPRCRRQLLHRDVHHSVCRIIAQPERVTALDVAAIESIAILLSTITAQGTAVRFLCKSVLIPRSLLERDTATSFSGTFGSLSHEAPQEGSEPKSWSAAASWKAMLQTGVDDDAEGGDSAAPLVTVEVDELGDIDDVIIKDDVEHVFATPEMAATWTEMVIALLGGDSSQKELKHSNSSRSLSHLDSGAFSSQFVASGECTAFAADACNALCQTLANVTNNEPSQTLFAGRSRLRQALTAVGSCVRGVDGVSAWLTCVANLCSSRQHCAALGTPALRRALISIAAQCKDATCVEAYGRALSKIAQEPSLVAPFASTKMMDALIAMATSDATTADSVRTLCSAIRKLSALDTNALRFGADSGFRDAIVRMSHYATTAGAVHELCSAVKLVLSGGATDSGVDKQHKQRFFDEEVRQCRVRFSVPLFRHALQRLAKSAVDSDSVRSLSTVVSLLCSCQEGNELLSTSSAFRDALALMVNEENRQRLSAASRGAYEHAVAAVSQARLSYSISAALNSSDVAV